MRNSPLAPEHIQQLTPYPPGKPISETRRELGLPEALEILKLASNENPLGPSPRALAAVRGALGDANLYPDGGAFTLKTRLADHLDVAFENLVLGNGSNEVIELLIRTFVLPGEKVLCSEHAFVVYRLISQAAGRECVQVPMDAELRHDLRAMAEAVKADPAIKVVFAANPNNPTGTWNSAEEVAEFLELLPREVIPVIDEAYVEYVTADDYTNALAMAGLHPRLVVLRTFSKAYGLAAMRCGYGVTTPELVDLMNRVRQPFNVNALAQVAATAALDDKIHVATSRDMNRDEMGKLEAALSELGLRCTPSQANFLLVHLGRSGQAVFDGLLRKGIIVRVMTGYGFPDAIRVTVGTPPQNTRFLEALPEVLQATQ